MTSSSKPHQITINFAHANGFPSASYKKLFNEMPDNFDVLSINKLGHNESFPVTNNWPHLVEELVEHIEKNSKEKVYAIGHSFGAVLSYLAVCKRPDLFCGLIMMDPPIFSRTSERYAIKLFKNTRFIDKLSPAGKAQNRRRSWSKETDVASLFRKHKLFANFDEDCLQDYVNAVIEEDAHFKKLTFKPEVEAGIFRTVPTNIHKYYGKLAVPTLLVIGEHTDVCLPKRIKPFIVNNDLDVHTYKGGGHMFPLEQPKETAALLIDTITQWHTAQ